MFEDKVLKHKRAEGYYRRNAALGNVDGAWKNFVESNKVQEPWTMAQAPLANELEPGALKDEMLKDFDPSQETHEEYLQRKNLERPFNMAEGGQLVAPTVDGSRPGYGGDDFVNLNDVKKYSKNLLDKSIMISTAPGRTGINQMDPVTLRNVFEVVKRTKDGEILIKNFKKDPTTENFLKLRARRKNRLIFEREQLLPPDEREAKLAKERVITKRWRESAKGQKYLNNLLAQEGIFPASTSQERVWRDIYRASKQIKETSRFKIKYPKNIEIDPETNLPKKIKSSKGNMYIPWDKYYKNLSFYDTETKSTIKFGNMREWMKNNIKGGGKKYDIAIDNYNIRQNIADFEVDGKSLGSMAKEKEKNLFQKRLTTPAAVNHRSGLNNFWDTEITTAIGNKQLNDKVQSRIAALKKAPNPMAKDRILKQMKAEINKIKGGATLVVDGQTIGKKPTLMKIRNALSKELNVDLLKFAGTVDSNCRKKAVDGGRIGFKFGSNSCLAIGKKAANEFLTNGKGTKVQRSLLQRIVTGGNTILKGTGKFVTGALNPIDFFRLKNLIGLPAAIAAVGFDTVAIADDVFRKGQPFDVAAGNEFLTQFLDLNTESKQAQRILDDKGSNLSPAAKEYAEALVDFGKYKNLLKEKNDVSKTGSLETFEEDQAKFDAQLKVLEEKFSNTREDGMLDYQAAVNELGINEEQSEYIGEAKKSKIPGYYYAADNKSKDGFYRNADGNRIKVNEYGYATKGNIFDIPSKTGARVDKKLPYGETDQGRNPALLTEREKIFRAETKQPAKYQKPFTYKDFNYQNKALSDEQYNKTLKAYQDLGFIKADQRLEDVNIPKGYNKRIVNGKEYDPPKTFLQDTTEFFNIGDKWKQAIYQPGMLGTQDKFAEGGIANTRVGFKTGSSIASILSKFFKPKPKKTITIKRGESGTIGASGNSERDFFNRYYFPPKGGFTNQSADARYFSKLGGPKGKPKVLTAEITPQELKEGYRLRSLDSKDPEIGDIIIPKSAKDKIKTDYYNTIRARIEKILKNND